MELIQLLLKQHVGAPCVPCVQPGDRVEKGTLVAAPQGLGANIFSSVYGTVEALEPDRICIRPDEIQPEAFAPIPLPEAATKLELIRYAGIVGMGGAGFPTGVKLDTDLHEGYVLVNAAECEPGLEHNIRQLEEQGEKTLRGIAICMEITGAGQAIIAVKRKHERAIRLLHGLLKEYKNISLHLLPDIYPMGEERAVVRECLGIELSTTQLPTAANAVVLNAETVLRVAEAVEDRRPCFSKNLTVRGQLHGGSGAHVFMDVPVGVSVGALLERAGGIDTDVCPYGEILMGGAFTGRSVSREEPVAKTTGAILVSADFPDLHGAPVGLLVCACGGSEARMRELAERMHGRVASVCRCKQAIENKPGAPLKCERPGNCPGQVQNNLQFKKDGCQYILIGNCSDCSNTVMASGPKMGLKVLHMTDHVMRAIGHPLYRRLKTSKQVSQEIDF